MDRITSRGHHPPPPKLPVLAEEEGAPQVDDADAEAAVGETLVSVAALAVGTGAVARMKQLPARAVPIG